MVAPLVNMNPISEEPATMYTQRTAAVPFVTVPPAPGSPAWNRPLMIVLVGSLLALQTVIALSI